MLIYIPQEANNLRQTSYYRIDRSSYRADITLLEDQTYDDTYIFVINTKSSWYVLYV